MRKITGIIVHCTATRPDWWAGRKTSQKVAEIKLWHTRDRKWSDIGYHFLIDRDGTIAKGRPITLDGAHVVGHNKGTIGISLFGGHGSDANDDFADHFTPDQDRALRQLINTLTATYGAVPVTGHNQYAAKACPGFRVPEWLDDAPMSSPPAANKAGLPPVEVQPLTTKPVVVSESPFHSHQSFWARLIMALIGIWRGRA